MFVFRPKDLPADPVYPADLKELGYEPPSYRIGIQVITRSSYFINDEDQIKKISDPDQDFQFKVNRNPRWNEVQREAMNCMTFTLVSTGVPDSGKQRLTQDHLVVLQHASVTSSSPAFARWA